MVSSSDDEKNGYVSFTRIAKDRSELPRHLNQGVTTQKNSASNQRKTVERRRVRRSSRVAAQSSKRIRQTETLAEDEVDACEETPRQRASSDEGEGQNEESSYDSGSYDGDETSSSSMNSINDVSKNKGQRRRTQKSRARLNENGENCREVKWNQKYQELVEYSSKYGDCLVPRSYKDKSLHNWVIAQRQEYRKWKHGKPSNMNRERQNALEKIGFVWQTKVVPKAVEWESRYSELCKYHEQHGDTLVPQKYKPNIQLGRWVETQRRQYKLLEDGKTSNLTLERMEALDSIGFVWTLRDQYANAFTAKLNKLRMFVAEQGHCNPDSKKNQELCRWVQEQRRQYRQWKSGRQSSMTDERCRILEELGIEWTTKKSSTTTASDDDNDCDESGAENFQGGTDEL